MDSLLFLMPIFIYVAHRMCEADPCLTHQNISDVDLLTDHKYVTGQSCDFTPAAFPPAWYRYTATPSGAIATSCPDENACGAKEKFWVNGTLPNYNAGITTVPLCLSRERRCCYNRFSLVIKNCNSFFVVQLRRPPNCHTNYCFNSSIVVLATVVTTPTTSTSSTTYSSTTTTTRVVTSSTSVTTTLLKSTLTTASRTTFMPSGPSTIPVNMSSKIISTLTSSTSISNIKMTTSAFRLQLIERGNNSVDKNKSESFRLAAGLGTAGAILLVAVVTTASIYLYRKEKCKGISILANSSATGDRIHKTQFNAKNFRHTTRT